MTPGGVGDTPVVQRYSVPHETRSLQSNLTRRYSGPSILCEDREVDVVWSGIMNQESPNYRMDQVARGEILPGEREFLNIIKRAGHARKDPETVCIHCEACSMLSLQYAHPEDLQSNSGIYMRPLRKTLQK